MKRIAFLLVVVASLVVQAKASGDPPVAIIDKTIELLRDFDNAPSASAWLAAHPEAVNPSIAATAKKLSDQAAVEGRLVDGIVTAQFAAAIYATLKQYLPALTSMMQVQDLRFMLAETPDRYAKVAADSAGLAKQAKQLSNLELEFKLRVIEADATYFQFDGESSPANDTTLLAALQRATAAFSLLPTRVERVWTDRLFSLTSAAVEAAQAQFRQKQDEIDATLKRLAPLLEKWVPSDFSYHGQNADQKTHHHTLVFAELSYFHGQAAIANARLQVAERRATEKHDPERLLEVIWHHYHGARMRNPADASLQQLRNDSMANIDSLRSAYRSRTGRLWAAYRADIQLGDMANDQFDRTASSGMGAAFSWFEVMKSRMLLDRLSSPSAREIATPAAKQLERSVLGFNPPSEQQGNIVRDEMRLASQLTGFATAGDAEKRLSALDQLETLYRSGAAGFSKVAVPAALAAVQQALQPGEIILEYLQPYSDLGPRPNVWILQITRETTSLVNVPLPKDGFIGKIWTDQKAPIEAGWLGDFVVGTRLAIRNADQKKAKANLKELYKVLVQPLVAKGLRVDAVKRLIVVPHGALHYVPFAALVDEKDRYLISRTQVVVAPSASVWLLLRSRSSTAKSWAGFVDPKVDDPNVPRLEFAAQEGKFIVRSFPQGMGKAYPGAQATLGNLAKVAPKTGYLHFATHGAFPDDDALDLHSLLMAPDKGRPSLLRAVDVRNLDLRETKLVALSVCNGGLYRIGPANEPYGLMPAFLEAGAQNVLGTLWPMEDQFGRDFMLEFYKHLAADGPAGAYQKASQHFIDDDELLRRWAGFVLVGPGRSEAP